jgi:hypothetical protein
MRCLISAVTPQGAVTVYSNGGMMIRRGELKRLGEKLL